MRRRTVLLSFGGSLALAGCLDSVAFGESEQVRPAELVDYSFATDVNTELPPGERGPRITTNRAESTVTVEGVGRYGSARCGYLEADEPSYDPESAALAVRVTAEQDRSGRATCEDDVASSPYRVVVQSDEGVPARVEATHPFQESATAEFP